MKKRQQLKMTETEFREVIHYQGKSFTKTQPFLKTFDECLIVIRNNPTELGSMPKEFRENKMLVKQAVEIDPWCIQFASPKLKKDKEIISICLQKDGLTSYLISQQILENEKTLSIKAIQQNGRALNHLPNKYKNDPSIVFQAVIQNPTSLQFASETLRRDRNFLLKLLKYDSIILKFCHEEIQRDREIVVMALEHFGISLEYSHHSLRDQKEIVLYATKRDKRAFKFASNRLKMDLELILLSKGMYYQLISPKMRKIENLFFIFIE